MNAFGYFIVGLGPTREREGDRGRKGEMGRGRERRKGEEERRERRRGKSTS